MKRIAVYGKGGIGKSTVSANAAAAMAAMGYRVMQIGCDPKADSTLLHGVGALPTVLDRLRAGGEGKLSDVVHIADDGVICVECGGPVPGSGCAGRGIVTAFDFLKEQNAYEIYQPDVILYDVLGDVVCGGFAMPMRRQYAGNVFIVTSGEKMALYAAANIALALDHFKNRGYARLSGFIQNSRNVKNEDALVRELAEENSVPVVAVLPRDPAVTAAEEQGRTVLSAFPDSETAAHYRTLAKAMLENADEL